MKKLCIVNQKGGSGKSSLSVLIVMALAAKGFKVLALDCDPQAGMTAFFDPAYNARAGIYDLIIEGRLAFIPIERNGIKFDLVPSDHRLDKIYGTMDNLSFKRVFKILDIEYDYLVFDCPPTVQGISRAAAYVADKVYIPADISRASLNPTIYTLEALAEIEKHGDVIFVGYKEPRPDNTSFLAELSRDFMNTFKDNYLGTVQRNAVMQKAVADNSQVWTQNKIEKILNPISTLIGA